MFPQFKKLNNKSGIVLFFVLMTAIIIMIFSVGILTQSMNEINYAQQQIDQITSDQLSKGLFWNAYSVNFSSLPAPTTLNESGQNGEVGRNYGLSLTLNPNAPSIPAVTSYNIDTSFNSS